MELKDAEKLAAGLQPEKQLSTIDKFEAMAHEFLRDYQEAKTLLPKISDAKQRAALQALIKEGEGIGTKVQWVTSQIDKANAHISAVKQWLYTSGTSPYVIGQQVGKWLRDELGLGAIPLVIPAAAVGAAIWGMSAMGSWLVKYRTEKARIAHIENLVSQGVSIEQARKSAESIIVKDVGLVERVTSGAQKLVIVGAVAGGAYLLFKYMNRRNRNGR